MNITTPDTIGTALAAQFMERHRVKEQTGLVIMGCPSENCPYTAIEQGEDLALEKLTLHLVCVHHFKEKAS